ncbi:MAG: DUF4124 domain-containing protein [Marinicellaceae bacterium]
MKTNCVFILILSLILLSGSANAKKKLYKWVDEEGNVTYSDQVPPDQIKKEHQELNKDGVVLEKISSAKTEEEIAAEREKVRLQKEAEKLAKEKEQIRQNIILAYTNEQEIVRLKEERISALERNIELAHQSLKFQKTSREQIMKLAADSERDGVEISKALKSRIKTINEKIKYQLQFIETKTKEIETIKAKFEQDLITYRNATKGEG